MVQTVGSTSKMSHSLQVNIMLTLDTVNQQINNIFASNDIPVDGPGIEAFWNAAAELRKYNKVAYKELLTLNKQYHQAVEELAR